MTAPPTPAARPDPPAAATPAWRERALLFGAHGALVGVLTTPNAGAPNDALGTGRPAAPRRAVLMANVGTHHRVGPHRLWVDLARRAAARGWCALRFDLSGLGDSAPRPTGEPRAAGDRAADQAAGHVADVREAMDRASAEAGATEFVLVGLCSGVDSAHAAALADPRVVGAVFIDGYTYPTAGFRLRRHAARFAQAARWARWARRQLRAWRARLGGGVTHARAALAREAAAEQLLAGGAASGPVFTRALPTHDEFRRDVAALAARGVRMLFVYTGTVDVRFNAERQLAEMLGTRHAGVDVARFAEADHVFSGTAHREVLLDRVLGWLGDA